MQTPPLVSVVIPTYNRLALLRDAIESVRAQTHGAWELIVVDDGSTDGTAEYLAGLAAREPRVRVLALPHVGVVGRLYQQGADAARGDYVAFQDSDNVWHPEKLALQLDALAAHPGARWSGTAAGTMDAAGTPLPYDRAKTRPPRSGWILEPLLTHEAATNLPSLLIERSLLAEIGGVDEECGVAADQDLMLRLAAAAECAAVDRPLVTIRLHGSQTSLTSREPASVPMLRVFEKVARSTASPVIRRICRRQQAFYAAHAALGWMARGQRGKALALMLRSLRYDARGMGVWKALRPILARRLRRPSAA
jgi:glycosyltransferase involved in cell wall biosynthesis